MSKLLIPVISEKGALPHEMSCSTFFNILKNEVPSSSSSSKILLSVSQFIII